jgi:hypothetical protein
MRLFTVTTFAILLNVVLTSAAPGMPVWPEKKKEKEKETPEQEKQRKEQDWRENKKLELQTIYTNLQGMRSMSALDFEFSPECLCLQDSIEELEVRVCYIF